MTSKYLLLSRDNFSHGVFGRKWIIILGLIRYQAKNQETINNPRSTSQKPEY